MDRNSVLTEDGSSEVNDMLNQEQLDAIIRRAKGDNAVDRQIVDTTNSQQYMLSDGTVLVISKHSGKGRIETASGSLIRRF